MSSSRFFLSILSAALLYPSSAFSQAKAPTPPRPMPTNGGFERFSSSDNLWDGVDASGVLAGFRGDAAILLESGAVGAYPMPMSVAVADMNRNGKLDLVVADPGGYMRIYFNQGTPQEPKFTQSELIPIFMPLSPDGVSYHGRLNYAYRTPMKIAVAPFRSPGVNDIVMGNYLGEFYMIQNSGSAMVPDFRQPPSVDKLILATSTGGRQWANLLAPAVHDMTGNGTLDILVGEGSYSANSIHLLVNRGSNNAPRFTDEDRFYLAFGDGKEQLTPTLADYNGDGFMDLIVGDRRGELSVYLHPGKGWKPGDEFPFASTIQLGTSSRMPGPIAPYAADLNGDGLFDLIIGKTNGRIAVAYNRGTPQEPKFDAPVELKGENVEPIRYRTPTAWTIYNGFRRGNANIQTTCVDEKEDPNAQPTEGKFAFRAGYLPSLNKIMKPLNIRLDLPGQPRDDFWHSGRRPAQKSAMDANWAARSGGNKHLILRNSAGVNNLKNNTSYEISFDVKGTKVRNARFALAYHGFTELGEAKITRGDRRSATVTYNDANEENTERANINVSPMWGRFTRTVRIGFRDRHLRELERVTAAIVEIRADLQDPNSVLYLDNIQFVER